MAVVVDATIVQQLAKLPDLDVKSVLEICINQEFSDAQILGRFLIKSRFNLEKTKTDIIRS